MAVVEHVQVKGSTCVVHVQRPATLLNDFLCKDGDDPAVDIEFSDHTMLHKETHERDVTAH